MGVYGVEENVAVVTTLPPFVVKISGNIIWQKHSKREARFELFPFCFWHALLKLFSIRLHIYVCGYTYIIGLKLVDLEILNFDLGACERQNLKLIYIRLPKLILLQIITFVVLYLWPVRSRIACMTRPLCYQ